MPFSFNNLPITTLVGADSTTFRRVCEGRRVDNIAKLRATVLCQRLLNPLYRLNDRIYRRTPMPDIISPIFIIGHWRSGTTFAHNLLSEDPQFGYCTTYQAVFPHLMFRGDRVMRHIAAVAMPKSRPTDNLALSICQPQEEELAIANITHAAHYHFWLFPQFMEYYRERFLLFNSTTTEEQELFSRAMVQVMQSALYCQGKSRFLSKNPPNTARIPMLLKMFPDAKFIYIYRNKGDVLRSTKAFFRQMIDSIALQKITTQELDYQIAVTYNALIAKYEQDRDLIADSNLVEVSFDRLTQQPQSSVDAIYKRLGLKMR